MQVENGKRRKKRPVIYSCQRSRIYHRSLYFFYPLLLNQYLVSLFFSIDMCLIPNNPLRRPLGSLFRFYAWIYLFNSPFTPLTTQRHTHTQTRRAAGGECEAEGCYPTVLWELDIIQYNKRKTEERRGDVFIMA